jgi:hypothetical protein
MISVSWRELFDGWRLNGADENLEIHVLQTRVTTTAVPRSREKSAKSFYDVLRINGLRQQLKIIT